jgi:spermidine/putrescine transport system permease protein
MTSFTSNSASKKSSATNPLARNRRKYRVGDSLLWVYTLLALVFLLTPIVYTIVFSFNDSIRSNTVWEGFTLHHWTNVCDQPGICEAVGNSFFIGGVATLVATIIGTMMAIALVRYRFRARSFVSLLLFLPMATPEIVMGAGLAALFFLLQTNGLDSFAFGYTTIILAHIMFCISFVVVTVKARVQTLDPVLEEAARDLYANPFKVFLKVTFPLLLPGIISAALLSFALSFDDFIITYFNNGATKTFPLFVYVSASRGVPAEANVVSSAVFLVAITVVIVMQVVSAMRRKKFSA